MYLHEILHFLFKIFFSCFQGILSCQKDFDTTFILFKRTQATFFSRKCARKSSERNRYFLYSHLSFSGFTWSKTTMGKGQTYSFFLSEIPTRHSRAFVPSLSANCRYSQQCGKRWGKSSKHIQKRSCHFIFIRCVRTTIENNRNRPFAWFACSFESRSWSLSPMRPSVASHENSQTKKANTSFWIFF